MELDELLHAMFQSDYQVTRTSSVVLGTGDTPNGRVAIVGTTDHAYMGVENALAMAGHVLGVIRECPGQPILILVDTQGQRLSRLDELLGINGYFAHLAKCLELARQRGHRIISLAYGEAVSGGFLASGMFADDVYALEDAQVRVMNLAAMSRVTKIPQERLEELSKTSSVLAPGVNNFFRLGGLDEVWKGSIADQLMAALNKKTVHDSRREKGYSRGGRLLAHRVASFIREQKPSNEST